MAGMCYPRGGGGTLAVSLWPGHRPRDWFTNLAAADRVHFVRFDVRRFRVLPSLYITTSPRRAPVINRARTTGLRLVLTGIRVVTT